MITELNIKLDIKGNKLYLLSHVHQYGLGKAYCALLQQYILYLLGLKQFLRPFQQFQEI